MIVPKVIEVDTLFIGGGPATLGVLSNAYQTQRLEDLILGSRPFLQNQIQTNDQNGINKPGRAGQGNHSFAMNLNQMTDPMGGVKAQSNYVNTFTGASIVPQTSGIAIIECSDQFGGGNLRNHYGIKSNTSASGFLKVVMYSKSNQNNNGSKSIS